ncbi:MAG: hypothetical protein K0S32_3739 [Bacteroidetes bacterium]|jgi:uncharacterized protein (TIGR02117 family)|nr:hypothetical protein [Bacteroidota bacterium]
MVRRIFKIIFKTLLGIIIFLALYFTAAYTLPHIDVNDDFVNTKDGIKIFVVSNGVHTDIVVPTKTRFKDWSLIFPPELFKAQDSIYSYTAFGWGDKGFYLNTPTWDDLTFSTAFKATFGLSGTAVHVRYVKQPKVKLQKCAELIIDEKSYEKLISYIEKSFMMKESNLLKIEHPGYGDHDLFYEAVGTYSAFKTCNVWTNFGLQEIGVKVCCWSPFSSGLMSSLQPEENK